MSSKSFRPMSRQEAERSIVREQKDFSAGVYKDIPATSIPDNGVADLKNFINKGTELVGRSGSKMWGNYVTGVPHSELPTIANDIQVLSNEITGSIRTIQTTGYSWANNNIGDFVVYPNGLNEKILNVVDADNIVVEINSDGEILADVFSMNLRKQLNGMYFHKSLKKVVMVLGEDVYVANDIYLSGWKKSICESIEILNNSICSIDEKDNYVLIFNINGIYRLDLDRNATDNYTHFKINSLIPQEKLIGVDKTENSVYCRRYIYGLGKLTGPDQNRDRQTVGVNLLIDSGTNVVDSNYIDYVEVWRDIVLSEEDGAIVSGLKVPEITNPNNTAIRRSENHWDVYTIWGTTDVSSTGLNKTDGTATDPSRYVWIADVPVVKSFEITISDQVCAALRGTFTQYDVGSVLFYYQDSAVLELTITSVDEVSNICTVAETYNSVNSVFTASLGTRKHATFYYHEDTNSLSLGEYIYGYNDISIGTKIYFDDGRYAHVSVVDISQQRIFLNENLSFNSTYIIGSWEPEERSIYDTLPDDFLRSRIAAYSCYQRLYENLPNCNMGVITSGFLVTSTRGSKSVFYSQLADGFDYLSGYYHPLYQFFTVKDGISLLKEMRDKLIIYGFNSTQFLLMTSYNEVNLAEIGVVIPVISQLIPIDENIGVTAFGGVQSLESNDHIMITNEPALRIFNGNVYSENLASKKMMGEIKRLQANLSSVYNFLTGYIFWGLNA